MVDPFALGLIGWRVRLTTQLAVGKACQGRGGLSRGRQSVRFHATDREIHPTLVSLRDRGLYYHRQSPPDTTNSYTSVQTRAVRHIRGGSSQGWWSICQTTWRALPAGDCPHLATSRFLNVCCPARPSQRALRGTRQAGASRAAVSHTDHRLHGAVRPDGCSFPGGG